MTPEERREYYCRWHAAHPGYAAAKRKAWAINHPEHNRRLHAAWEKKNYAKLATWRHSHRLERNAQFKVRTAVKSGRLIRPANCPNCGLKSFTQAHHEDYSKPLDVLWLCVPCHLQKHGKAVRTWKNRPSVALQSI